MFPRTTKGKLLLEFANQNYDFLSRIGDAARNEVAEGRRLESARWQRNLSREQLVYIGGNHLKLLFVLCSSCLVFGVIVLAVECIVFRLLEGYLEIMYWIVLTL